jgi:hypothetical protein
LAQLVEERLADLGALVAKSDAAVITERLRRKFLTTRQPVLRGQIHQLLAIEDLTDESIVGKREGAICVLTSADEEMSVLLGDRELRMPAWLEPALQTILGQDRFRVSDLAPYLDRPGRLVLVRRLILEGLLEVVE